MRYSLTVAAGYAAILVWFAYHGDYVADWLTFTLLFVAPFVASLAGGPWVALALPAAILIAVPAGYGTGDTEIPIWLGMMIVSLIALPVIVIGSVARWLVTWYASRAGMR